jgi:tetratricopeptide (TPR) repeat protein
MVRKMLRSLFWVNAGIHLFFMPGLQAQERDSGYPAHLPFRSEMLLAWQELIHLDLSACRRRCAAFSGGTNPDPAALYLDHLAVTVGLLTDSPDLSYSEYRDLEEKHLVAAGALDPELPFQLFVLSEIRLQAALVRLKFSDHLSALWTLRQAFLLARKNNAKFPDFIPSYKTLGLLEVAFGHTPEQYHWLLRILGMQTDAGAGMAALQRSGRADDPVGLESRLLGALVHAYLMSDPEAALRPSAELLLRFPGSPLLCYVFASVAMKNAQSEAAFGALPPPGDPGYRLLPPLHYLSGEIHLQKREYDTAKAEYDRFLAAHRGRNLVKDAHFKAAMSLWLSGREADARARLRFADGQGERSAEVDKNADNSIRSGLLPHPVLLQARYSTDGGYYRDAEQSLLSIEPGQLQRLEDQTEYHYRLGRLRHRQGHLDLAVDLYLRTIELQGPHTWYLAPNACLQLGYIYAGRGEKEQARRYFRQAAVYKDHPYVDSIRSKSRNALNGLDK